MRRTGLFVIFYVLVLVSLATSSSQFLSEWRIQSSTVAGTSGSVISTTLYNNNVSSWYGPVQAPCTVVACLLQLGEVGTGPGFDPFYGENFSLISPTPYQVPWWYRAEFSSSASAARTLITLTGINYRADVWLNGVMLASSNTTVGSFRYFDFDISTIVVASSTNVIALLIYPPSDPVFPPSNNATDLAITFVDWAPNPPDQSMGIWREVLLEELAGDVSVRYPAVSTEVEFDSSSAIMAYLSPMVEITNWANMTVQGTVQVDIEGIASALQQHVSINGGETLQVIFSNKTFSQLNAKLRATDLWWPWQMGTPTLKSIVFSFTSSAASTETLATRFGIRQVSSALDRNGNRVFLVNNQRILVRGAGWAPDLFLRYSTQRFTQELSYVRDMGLNAVRLEGKFENDSLWTVADEMGLLMLPGICCCDAWQHWKSWGPEQVRGKNEEERNLKKKKKRRSKKK